MKICVIGAGASGVAAAIKYQQYHVHDEVFIIEHSDKALKKVLATGNGRCNLGNSSLTKEAFNYPKFLSDYSFNEYVKEIESFGFKTKLLGNLLYPISESAQTVRNQMLFQCQKNGVDIHLNEEFKDYRFENNRIVVETNLNEYLVDKLIIATGGQASPQLGSDGSIYPILERHHYHINPLRPGLVPIKTVEKTKIIDGVRVKADVKLLEDGREIFQESGEVLFKKDGLSGIVILNLSNHISDVDKKIYKIVLDLVPELSQQELENYQQNLDKSGFLSAFLQPKLIAYFRENKYQENIVKNLKELTFTFRGFYDYEFSQVTLGGVDPNGLFDNLESKHEKNVFLIGEVVDVHGPCGGYNLTWAFHSAMKVSH